jgi:uncharacterized membrane protein
MSIRIRTVVVLLALLALHGLKLPHAGTVLSAAPPHGKPGASSGIGSLSVLPSLGSNSEALAVDAAGTTIVGSSFDRRGLLHAVKWTQIQGVWTLTDLPWTPGASSVVARGVNNRGDAAGNDYPSASSRAVLWPITGGVSVLGCSTDVGPTSVYGISANGQTVVGTAGGSAALWQPGKCLVSLPTFIPGQYSSAGAVNGDGTIIGGSVSTGPTAGVPARWTLVAGQWQVEQLDALTGTVLGANAVGDLAGYVYVSCALADGCQRAAIWYAAGGSQVLGTLGGDTSWAYDINSSGEVIGGSTPAGSNAATGFFWSESTGMVPLAVNGSWAAARALSDVRPDGTRLVVGTDARARAVVWVIANP